MGEKSFGECSIESEVGERVFDGHLESVSISNNSSKDGLDAIGYATMKTPSFEDRKISVSIGYIDGRKNDGDVCFLEEETLMVNVHE